MGTFCIADPIWQWKQLYYSGLFDFRFDIRSMCVRHSVCNLIVDEFDLHADVRPFRLLANTQQYMLCYVVHLYIHRISSIFNGISWATWIYRLPAIYFHIFQLIVLPLTHFQPIIVSARTILTVNKKISAYRNTTDNWLFNDFEAKQRCTQNHIQLFQLFSI